jgi:hypothetical protein
MASDDAVAFGPVELCRFAGGGGRRENELVDAIDAAMRYGKAVAVDFNIDAARQARHPSQRIIAKLSHRVRKPGGRQSLAGAAGRNRSRNRRRRLPGSLAIAHDHVAAGVAHKIDRCGWIGAMAATSPVQ